MGSIGLRCGAIASHLSSFVSTSERHSLDQHLSSWPRLVAYSSHRKLVAVSEVAA